MDNWCDNCLYRLGCKAERYTLTISNLEDAGAGREEYIIVDCMSYTHETINDIHDPDDIIYVDCVVQQDRRLLEE